MRRILSIVCILLAGIVALLLYSSLHDGSVPSTDARQPPVINAVGINTPHVRNVLRGNNSPVVISNSQTTEGVKDSLRAVSNAWSNQIQKTIFFYGLVLDDKAQPVAQASVSFVCSQYATEQSSATNADSDNRGLFSVTGLTGGALSVHVEKPGYYSVKTNQSNFQYSEVAGSTSFQPEANNPVVFRLRKKGGGAELVTGSLNVKADLNGVATNLDLLAKITGVNGQLQISQQKPPYASWKSAAMWSFRLSISDGGFFEENEEFPFEAPVAGYIPTLEFGFQKGQPNWATGFKRSYYIKFSNPARYGWLTVETDITWAGFRLWYAINPDGSQNLEPAN